MKKWISVLLAVVMLLPLIAACQLTDDETNSPDPSETAGSDLDLTAVVATVGDETITLGDVKTLFDSYVTYFSYYGYDVTSDAETLKQFQDDIVNKLVEDKLIEVKAKELGYDKLTEEQQAELDKRVQDELAAMQEYYRGQAEEEAASDSTIDVETRIQELILEEAAYNMSKDDATYEEYTAFIREDIAATYLGELLKAGELTDVTIDEGDVQTEYQSLVEADTTAYTEDPAAYQTAQGTYESLGEGLPAMYVPEGYHRIYDIFIKFEGTLSEDYDANQNKMKTLKTEYQELAFADAVAGTADNAARMAEILTEYNALQTACDQMYDEYTASAKTKIDDLYAQIQGGADFKELMLANTQNEGFASSELYAERGMLIATADYTIEGDWGDNTKETFKTLAVGQYSAPYAENDGYHIIFYVGDETPGVRLLEGDVYDAVKAQVLTAAQDTEWQAILDAWKADGTVTINEEAYRALGATTDTEE
ncbi:MAG TPA: SurA N-terminal domain-containing protein [Clostridia bacterium]|nr:SurA N-terminal domain-containing protein [Clostridia bacterium]